MTKLSGHRGCTHYIRWPGGHSWTHRSHENSILLICCQNARASCHTRPPSVLVGDSLSKGHFVFSCFIGIFFRKRGNIHLSCSSPVPIADISPVSDTHSQPAPIFPLYSDSEIEDDLFSGFAFPTPPSPNDAYLASTSYLLSTCPSPSLTTSNIQYYHSSVFDNIDSFTFVRPLVNSIKDSDDTCLTLLYLLYRSSMWLFLFLSNAKSSLRLSTSLLKQNTSSLSCLLSSLIFCQFFKWAYKSCLIFSTLHLVFQTLFLLFQFSLMYCYLSDMILLMVASLLWISILDCCSIWLYFYWSYENSVCWWLCLDSYQRTMCYLYMFFQCSWSCNLAIIDRLYLLVAYFDWSCWVRVWSYCQQQCDFWIRAFLVEWSQLLEMVSQFSMFFKFLVFLRLILCVYSSYYSSWRHFYQSSVFELPISQAFCSILFFLLSYF